MRAVVVAHDPGDWFDETLESLSIQDYEHLKVTVVDAASSGVAARVAAVIAGATVIDAGAASGFSQAANEILRSRVEEDFLLVCHDDVALAPDAVSTLVAEALRSNAGVVGPKIVEWGRPEILQHAGYEVDRFAVSAERVASQDLDQEQHDGVSDVFALPSAVLLVRSELFVRLGGFDAGMAFRGEDVDFCWRAQMAGSRVMFVGGAVARHRQDLVSRTGMDDARRTRARHSLRAMLVNHGRISLTVLLPAAAAMTFVEVLLSVLTARFGRAGDAVGAWVWNLRRLRLIMRRRQANARVRVVRQADVTALQYFGSLRLLSVLRRSSAGELVGRAGSGRAMLGGLRTGTPRWAWITWILVLGFVVFGSRRLITSGVPAVADFAALPDSGGDLLRQWWGGWSQRNAGAPSSNLGVLVYLGLLGGAVTSMELVRTFGLIALIAVGLVGAYRLLAATGSRRAQAASLVAYLVVPLAPVSVAGGSLAGLVAYAAAPWLLKELLRASGTAPFRNGQGQTPQRGRFKPALSLGIAAGLAALVVPAAAGLVIVMAAGLVVGSLLAGRPESLPRLLASVVLALPALAFLTLPTVVDLLASGPDWAFVADGRDGSAGGVSFSEILRFAVAGGEAGRLVWLFAAPMALPLLLGRGWRLEQAVRLWMVAFAAWGLALAAQRGMLPFGLPDLQLLLAPAAVAVAGLCGMAVLSIEHDLRFNHFGWRQVMVPVTALACLILAAGSVGSLEDGRWGLAAGDHHSALRFEAPVLEGAYRVLWIGAPEFLPMQGHSFAPGVAWAVSNGDSVTLLDRGVPFDQGSADRFESVIERVEQGDTARAGRLLGGLGVRYVVLLNRLASAPFSEAADARPVPANLAAGMSNQLDLELVEGTNSAVDMFANTAWAPMRALYPEGFDAAVTDFDDLEADPLPVGAALFSSGAAPWRARVPGGAEILVSQTPRPGWSMSLQADDAADAVGSAGPAGSGIAASREALAWTQAFQTGSGGVVELSYTSPWWRKAGQVIGAAAPAVLALAWLRRRISRS